MTVQNPTEKKILDDIRSRAALSFLQIGAINTRDKAIADIVLPILRDWVPLVKDANIRGAIFHQFGPHSSSYMDSLLHWWQVEDDRINAGLLTQAIVEAAKPAHAESIWHIVRDAAEKPFYFMLLSKLASFSNVAAEVKDALVKALDKGTVPSFELQFVAKVDDLRIRRWFESQLESPDLKVRQQAQRVVAKRKKLPRNFAISSVPPDRRSEIFSTEVDLIDIRETMEKIATQLDLKIPLALKKASFLDSVQLNQWIYGHIEAVSGELIDLWLRLEDIDTVEILVTRSKEQRSPATVQ